MFNFLKRKKAADSKNLNKIAEKELRENLGILESLREYDAGKKDIPTDRLERRLPNIRVAS